jgi:hypothetical protein
MMQGVVNLRREAIITVVVGNSNRQLQAIALIRSASIPDFWARSSSNLLP